MVTSVFSLCRIITLVLKCEIGQQNKKYNNNRTCESTIFTSDWMDVLSVICLAIFVCHNYLLVYCRLCTSVPKSLCRTPSKSLYYTLYKQFYILIAFRSVFLQHITMKTTLCLGHPKPFAPSRKECRCEKPNKTLFLL